MELEVASHIAAAVRKQKGGVRNTGEHSSLFSVGPQPTDGATNIQGGFSYLN